MFVCVRVFVYRYAKVARQPYMGISLRMKQKANYEFKKKSPVFNKTLR